MDKLLHIAIMAGGNSSEAEISLRGAAQMAQWLNPNRFVAHTVLVHGTQWTIKHPQHGDVPVGKDCFAAQLPDGHELRFDCALVMIHGTPGENGLLQGYLEMMGIPHTTCSTMSAALTFNKFVCKEMVRSTGVGLARGVLLHSGQPYDTNAIVAELGLPMFVKPNASGSSYGVSKVKCAADLPAAIEAALAEGDEVLLEEFIGGREFSCGVFKPKGEPEMLMPVTEIISHTEFFDYNAKYNHQSNEVTPAQIPAELSNAMQQMASCIYDRLQCSGIVRVDYIVTPEGKPYFLEINTVPGMSAESIIPQQVRAMGSTMRDVLTQLVDDAMLRHARR